MYKTILLLIITLSFDTVLASGNHLKIAEAQSATEVLKIIEQNAKKGATVFLDIDDTIIAPKSNSFRDGHHFIDEMKKHSADYGNFVDMLSDWRLKRRTILIGEDWPKVILKLRNDYAVYGLTKMDSGSFGKIASMEKWREKELRNLGIIFTQNDVAQNLRIDMYKMNPTFYGGILFTGSASKSEALMAFDSALSPTFVVLVDDRLEHLQDVEEFCKNNDLEFLGIHFTGAKFLPGVYRPDIAEFQKKYLIEHSLWLEDDEAERLLN